jgi:hypothetical protein
MLTLPWLMMQGSIDELCKFPIVTKDRKCQNPSLKPFRKFYDFIKSSLFQLRNEWKQSKNTSKRSPRTPTRLPPSTRAQNNANIVLSGAPGARSWAPSAGSLCVGAQRPCTGAALRTFAFSVLSATGFRHFRPKTRPIWPYNAPNTSNNLYRLN